jgi:hypothetical protein
MNLVSLKIRGTVVTSRYGVLSSGDVLRTDAEYARHLVDECKAAEYAEATPAEAEAAPAQPAQPQAKPRKSKG